MTGLGAGGDAWEPWSPQRGSSVRIRLSGECPGLLMRNEDGAVIATFPHLAWDGEVGQIAPCPFEIHDEPCPWVTTGHPYFVAIGEDYGVHFAAIELEPLDA